MISGIEPESLCAEHVSHDVIREHVPQVLISEHVPQDAIREMSLRTRSGVRANQGRRLLAEHVPHRNPNHVTALPPARTGTAPGAGFPARPSAGPGGRFAGIFACPHALWASGELFMLRGRERSRAQVGRRRPGPARPGRGARRSARAGPESS